MIHTCSTCGQKNRVPEQYTGIPVCGTCREPVFETQIRVGKPKRIRRWTWRDRYLAIPILMLAAPIYWAINHDWTWLWDRTIDWVTTISVNLTIITAIALAWLIIAIALKVAWEDLWGSWRNRTRHPPGTPLIDLGPWEAIEDFITRARQWARRLALRKERP